MNTKDAQKVLFGWFKSRGGSIDESAMGLTDFAETGRGAVALRDIQEDEVLFEIPRDVVLSTRTSALPRLLGEEDFAGLGTGWAGLILCMMWEEAKGSEGKWAGYFGTMPKHFTTPMFWSQEELDELKGSTLTEKIGKIDAETDYNDRVLPLIQRRSDLFDHTLLNSYYSLENYHINGSRILSRSFHVEPWKGAGVESGRVQVVDEDGDTIEIESDGEEAESEDTADVGMTPMADILNARFETDNARLFYEESTLRMMATKPIRAGDQIWNTYGDPPNSDLLRRYGHVDLVETRWGPGNPADVVEIKADVVLEVVQCANSQERIDFFLEEGSDDVFVMEASEPEVPEDLISFIRLVSQSDSDWAKTKNKGDLPEPKKDVNSLNTAVAALQRRLSIYPTLPEEDEELLKQDLSLNKRNAVIVRLGEKRILRHAMIEAMNEVVELRAADGSDKKRKRKPEESSRKKSKR